MEINELNVNAKGGTELMMDRLFASLDADLLSNFQIIPSRARELDETKLRIFWAHDLAGDPEATNALGNGKWENYHKIVFVSYWQRDSYINAYRIPYSKCVVLRNAIAPIQRPAYQLDDKIKLIYTPTPHRGLQILLPVFSKLAEEFENIELDVYSSFKLYGWEDRDEQFAELFNFAEQHPKINYHGSVSNDEVRRALAESHVFAYPSIWPETSCLCLIEAMSAGLVCVHPDLAALPETSGGQTTMYPMHEDMNTHAGIFYNIMRGVIQRLNTDKDFDKTPLINQQVFTGNLYNWGTRKTQWELLLKSLLGEDRALPKPKFVYSTT